MKRAWLLSLALAAVASAAQAQTFPSKPVHVVVPFPGGPSGVDLTARLIAPKLSEFLGQPVVMENRAGANGMIGSEAVARSAPDGYTLLFTTPSTHITAVFLSKNVPYDPQKDFTPISAVVEPVSGLYVNSALPINTMRELIEYAKRNPGKLSYASSGIGSVFHLAGESLAQQAGIDILHVPYKGTQQALTDTAAGTIQIMLSALSGAVPFARSGKVRLIAIIEGRRFSGLPEVPTIGETVPGYERPPSWFGYFGPAKMPRDVVARLNSEIVRAIALPELKARFLEGGLEVIGNTPEQFAEQIRRGFDIYGKAVKLVGLKPE